MGQRTLLIAHVSGGPNVAQSLSGQAPFQVYTSPGLGLERVLTRRFSLWIEASTFSPTLSYDWQGRQGTLRLPGQQLRTGLRLYNFLQRGNLAPVGPYQEISLFGLSLQPYDQTGRLFTDGRRELESLFDLGIGVALGTHWLLGKRWVIDLALRGDWPFALARSQDPEIRQYLNDISAARLRRLMGLRLQLGVGMLW